MSEVININSIGKNILTTAPYTIYQAGLLAWLVTGDFKYGFFTLLTFVMGDGANFLEKKFAKKIMDVDDLVSIGERPNACGMVKTQDREISCTGCGIYPSSFYDEKNKTWGMPSGHAQITSFAAMYWTIYLWTKYREATRNMKPCPQQKSLLTRAIISSVVMWLLAFMVWSQRVYSRCHTKGQIFVGFVIGSLLGVLGYFISSKIFKDIPAL